MSLLQRFANFISQENLFKRSDTLLLAVSGGVDSVVLCELCKQQRLNFIIAHCNFQLRGAESIRDEDFVAKLADNYGVPFLVKKFETEQFALDQKSSIQVAARELRYDWFKELLQQPANEPAPRYLLTAHHADDNIETVLMNFFKGTGITGLRGILPKQLHIVRPLLFASKQDITDFAELNGLDYVQDSSNESNKYTRNYFRNQLLPAIQEVFPAVHQNLANNINRFRDVELLYMQSIERLKKNLLQFKGKEVHIPILKLQKSMPLKTIVYEIIKEYGFSANQTYEVIALFEAESGKYIRSAEYRIIKNRNWLVLSPDNTTESQTIVIDKADKKLSFEKGVLEFKELPILNCQLSSLPTIAQLDADKIIFPLILRQQKQSDYFYPLGMQKKKKLNRFVSNLKLSVSEKEQVWVLEMNKKIVWVIGYRIDDRFKILPTTRSVLQIRFTPGD